MSIEAMKQALEAMERIKSYGNIFMYRKTERNPYDQAVEAMTALRQAIAEAEKQEPAFYVIPATDRFGEGYEQTFWEDPAGFPVYTRPVYVSDISQERVDETAKDQHEFEEMVKRGTKAWADTPDDWVDDLRGGAEPVAWREIMGKWKTHYYDYNEDGRGEPLYTAPREWVGLTDEEILACDPSEECWGLLEVSRKIEAKLKEKNHG